MEKAEAKLEKNKCIVIDKLKGIWKITQIVTEIGLNSSNERLESLSNPENLTSLENLSKEYEKLKSVTTMLSSSITKVCNSVDALKDDLSCENGKYSFYACRFTFCGQIYTKINFYLIFFDTIMNEKKL